MHEIGKHYKAHRQYAAAWYTGGAQAGMHRAKVLLEQGWRHAFDSCAAQLERYWRCWHASQGIMCTAVAPLTVYSAPQARLAWCCVHSRRMPVAV